jgi:dTDP-4-amino-4,6-dideoxygalactose transaminase
MKALQENRIGCAIYYPVPLHRQNVFKNECADVSLPHTETVAAKCLSLPICSELDDPTIEKIAGVIRGVLKR